jgi:peptidase U32-like protein
MLMKKTRQFLAKLKLPAEDNHALKPSTKRFRDGGEYRIEIPSCEGPRVFRAVLEAAKEYRVPIHRVSQGSGILLLTREEIKEMASLGQEHRIEVCLFIGPRAPFETGAQALAPAGKVIGWQHRGADQLVYAIEDVRRACELGIRSVLPADLGLIWVLQEMKQKGELPKNLVLKSSVTLPAANPATAKVFERVGVSTLNIPTDLSPAQIGALRQAVDIPIDMYIEVPDNFGGFIRYYEMMQLVQVAAPIYFKFGLRNAPDIYPSGLHLESTAISLARERVRRARIALDLLEQYAPQAKMSPLGSKDLGIPEI